MDWERGEEGCLESSACPPPPLPVFATSLGMVSLLGDDDGWSVLGHRVEGLGSNQEVQTFPLQRL